jgi:predicted DsbA family dithiol-disulfide isomerase
MNGKPEYTKRSFPMIIDVYQDTVCPWCRIGKANLLRALKTWEGAETVTIRWHAYQLDPTTPLEGRDFNQSMIDKMGGPERLKQIMVHLTQAGAASGLLFDYEKITRMPNTLLSHQLISLAPEAMKLKLIDAIYKAYFEEGQDIGSLDVLIALAEELQLDGTALREKLQANAALEAVKADIASAQNYAIRGVPYFVFDGKLAVSGAQAAEGFLSALKQAAEV